MQLVVVIGFPICFLIVLSIAIYLVSSTQVIPVKSTYMVSELGDSVYLDPEYYLDTHGLSMDDIELTTEFQLDEVNYSIDPDTLEVRKYTNRESDQTTYLPIGTYQLKFTRGWRNAVATLAITDTVAPEFIGFYDEIVIEQYAEDVDLTDFFCITDYDSLSSFQIYIRDWDTSEQGDTTVLIRAWDTSGNQVEKTCTVSVISQTEAEKHPEKLTRTVKGAVPVSKRTKEKIANGKLKETDYQTDLSSLPTYPGDSTTYIVNGTQTRLKEDYEEWGNTLIEMQEQKQAVSKVKNGSSTPVQLTWE